MKPFKELTYRGKRRRLRTLALNALTQYDLDITKVQFISDWTNTIFRIRTKNRLSYMLRTCEPEWRTEEDLRSEVMWLQALHRDTDIGAPEPIQTRNGEDLIEVFADGVPESRRCLVTSWLPGSMMIGPKLNETNVYKMGTLFARLHQHGSKFTPPSNFTTLKMDGLYVRRENQTLFDHSCNAALTSRTRDILNQAWDKVNDAYKNRYAEPKGLRVIHNDLHQENINVYHGKLYPYDFEDTVWGYPVQDIATAMFDLILDAPEKYSHLRTAFRHGYESHSPWPETYPEEIDTFQTGFILWRINFIARGERKGDLNGWIQLLEKFLRTGIVNNS